MKVAIASVALSIAIMLLSVSIVGGFRREIVHKVSGFNQHIALSSASESGVITLTPALDSIISSTDGVLSYNLNLSLPAILKTPSAFKGVYLRSIPHGPDSIFMAEQLEQGALPACDGQILLSHSVASHLALSPGDSLALYVVGDEIVARRLRVSGIFNSRFEDYDKYLAYSTPSLLRDLVHIHIDAGSVIEITTRDMQEIPAVEEALNRALAEGFHHGRLEEPIYTSTMLERGANYFAWLDMLDTNVWIILVLMTIVATFTLISGVLIIILEKVRFIGVMKALGASSRRLRSIFVLLAVRIAAIGLVVGNGVALALILVQKTFHLIPLNPEAYYIDFVPVSLPWGLFLLVNVAFVVVIYAVLIIPAGLVSRISPAESMRFEQ